MSISTPSFVNKIFFLLFMHVVSGVEFSVAPVVFLSVPGRYVGAACRSIRYFVTKVFGYLSKRRPVLDWDALEVSLM